MTKLPHFYDWTKACETALAPSSPLLALQEQQSIAWAPIHSQSEAQALTLTLERIYSVGKPHASRSQNAPRFIKRTPQHGNQDPELHLISYGLISLKQKRKALHCLMKSIWKSQRSLQVQSLFDEISLKVSREPLWFSLSRKGNCTAIGSQRKTEHCKSCFHSAQLTMLVQLNTSSSQPEPRR